jgi:hypothetical protein
MGEAHLPPGKPTVWGEGRQRRVLLPQSSLSDGGHGLDRSGAASHLPEGRGEASGAEASAYFFGLGAVGPHVWIPCGEGAGSCGQAGEPSTFWSGSQSLSYYYFFLSFFFFFFF